MANRGRPSQMCHTVTKIVHVDLTVLHCTHASFAWCDMGQSASQVQANGASHIKLNGTGDTAVIASRPQVDKTVHFSCIFHAFIFIFTADCKAGGKKHRQSVIITLC